MQLTVARSKGLAVYLHGEPDKKEEVELEQTKSDLVIAKHPCGLDERC